MSLLRKLEWGRYPAQGADFYAAYVTGCYSIIVDKVDVNNAGTTEYAVGTIAISKPAQGSYRECKRTFMKLAMTNIRALLGHSPVIVGARFWMYQSNSITPPTQLPWGAAFYRLLKTPDWADVNCRYRDISAVTPWGNDAGIYAPVAGLDYHPTAFSVVPITLGYLAVQWRTFDFRTELQYVLSANVDMLAMFAHDKIGEKDSTGASLPNLPIMIWKEVNNGMGAFWPYLDIAYLMPVEFFGAKADDSIDLTNVLNNALDLGAGNLFLGAVERGEIGTPVPAFLKNLSTRDLKHLEVWDDTPEWSKPAPDAGNTGNAVLAYVTLLDTAVSQKYTIKFISATEYQVKAQAYADNPTNLHNQYTNSGWQGAVGTNWTAPSGGLVLPAAAWSGTAVANDIFVVYVHGQTTDAAWPADSNIQVEMAKDDAGSPDNATWRPIKGQRARLSSSVTIDSTTKTLSVEQIVTADWPAERKIFIADGVNIDEGHIDSVTATSITVHFGTATSNVYAIGAKVCTTLPFRDLVKSVRGTTSAAAGASQTNPAQIPLVGASTLGFVTAAKIVIQSSVYDDVYEEATVASADTSKIICTGYLANDYEAGATVVQGGSGEVRFWLRLNTLLTTVEELKRVRLNIRT